MYADDHQLYFAGKSIEEVENTINEEGKIVSKWYEINLLQGNFSKYQVISFGPKKQTQGTEYWNNGFDHWASLRVKATMIDNWRQTKFRKPGEQYL